MTRLEQLFDGKLPRLVMFDLDGTLMDSVPDLAAAVDKMLMLLGREPANTLDPAAPGRNRLPSSFIHATTSTGLVVTTPAALSASSTSSPATTPYTPSKRPPVGWESMCDPITTGSRSSCIPGRRTKRLAASSWKTLKLRACAQSAM